MNKPRKIDHEYTGEIVCPYCGNEFMDSWETNPGDEDIGLQECGECEKSFYANRHISISYSTRKATYGTCKECGSEGVPVEDYHSTIGIYTGLCVDCGYKSKRQMEIEYGKQIAALYKEARP